MNQRWLERRHTFRRPDEQINVREYDVAPIATGIAKPFVVQHHYSGSFAPDRFRFGLYRSGTLVGVAVFGGAILDSVLTSVFPGEVKDSVELNRFVLLDEVPGNGETWFLGRCFAALRGQVRGVLSHSDPEPREIDGRIVFAGHIGTIYQAFNGVHLGRGVPNYLHLLPDGTVFSRRAQQKIRKGERGWRYAAGKLQAFGADACPDEDAPRRAWLRRWLPALTKTRKHPGNLKYAWKLDRRVEMIGAAQPYPKRSTILVPGRQQSFTFAGL